jgi:hypothetical protein
MGTDMASDGQRALDPIVRQLALQTFSAKDVCTGANIAPDVLTNILSKRRPILFSSSAGQGRARRYCLLDVYQISLIDAFTKLTSKAQWSADAVGLIPFEEIADYQNLDRLRAELRADICKAHDLYWTPRVRSESWLISADDYDVNAGLVHQLAIIRADKPIRDAMFIRRGYFINATKILQDADERLMKAVGKCGGHADARSPSRHTDLGCTVAPDMVADRNSADNQQL